MTAGNRGAPPTRLASVLLLQLLSHPLMALKKKYTSTYLLWMSLWPHISARPQLSDGRRGRAIRPSRAEPHLHSLDAPTRRLDKRFHSMAVLQVFQAKMLANEEAGLDSASLRDLRSVTDLALRATKATALWSEEKSSLHINCLEMLAVCQACQFFLPDIRVHHVLIRSDSRSVVSYINHQGGLVSKRLCTLVNNLLVWAQNNLRSLKATHVPGKMNQGADMWSRNNVSSEEWTLHLLTIQRIWEIFGRARVDLFASKDNSHCPIFFTRSTDALAHEFSPSRSANAGTQASQGTTAQANSYSPPLDKPTVGVGAAPWPIPLRQDLLSQANGTIWHPRPELWALHV